MRYHFHQRPVFAGARLAFIGVAEDVFWLGRFLRNEAPFHSSREARAAAAAQIRFFYFVDHLIWRQFLERALHALVAVVRHVHIELVRVLHAEEPADHRDFSWMTFFHRTGNRRRGVRPSPDLERLKNLGGAFGGEVFVEIVVYLHRRRARASSQALDFLERENTVRGGLFVADFEFLLHKLVKLIAAAQHARHVRA